MGEQRGSKREHRGSKSEYSKRGQRGAEREQKDGTGEQSGGAVYLRLEDTIYQYTQFILYECPLSLEEDPLHFKSKLALLFQLITQMMHCSCQTMLIASPTSWPFGGDNPSQILS